MAKATAPTSRGSTAKSKSPSPAWLAAPTWAEAPASATASAAPPRVALAVPEPVQSPAPTASTPPAAGTAPMPFPRQSEADDPRLASTAQEPPDYAARARELMATHIPRIAQRAERLVMRVLFVAAQADDAAGDEAIRSAASAVRLAPRDPLTALAVSAHEARRLNEAGRNAFWSRGSVEEAVAYQSRAFGADPTDPEIVGNLAFLRLKQRPAQPEAARELALHALAVHDARHPTGRIEDWTTLAIASALAGRDRDARDAWLVSLALAPNVARQCRAALNAYAIYGERLRGPVEAMLHRAQTSGRGDRSAFCEWPPHWVADGGLR
jgi:tetratricopeptide (TPR) repeat protein